jgi:hypothetical protein
LLIPPDLSIVAAEKRSHKSRPIVFPSGLRFRLCAVVGPVALSIFPECHVSTPDGLSFDLRFDKCRICFAKYKRLVLLSTALRCS